MNRAAEQRKKEAMPPSANILLVEDDAEIGDLVRGLFEREGYEPRVARSGKEMDRALGDRAADLIVLDLMLPGEDGLSICRRLRVQGNVPILMLTAKGEDIDRIIGLELGADDYLAKPFNPRELIARIRAVLRRTLPAAKVEAVAGRAVRFADFLFEIDARRLSKNGVEIELSTGDYDLLCILVQHPQRVLSRTQLMDLTKGRTWEAFDRSIDVALSRLRRKIEPGVEPPALIKTVRNAGYVLATPVAKV